MGKSDLMNRVATDLARGHTHPAIQRLHTLIADHPSDLDLRRQLAAVYRSTGDQIEAGRWSYLDENADLGELAAFERAFPPARRRAALRWPQRALPPTEFVRDRLSALADDLDAPATAVPPARRSSVAVRQTEPRHRSWWMAPRPRVAVSTVVGALALVGLYAIVEWLLA
jgi:hypothetical protein